MRLGAVQCDDIVSTVHVCFSFRSFRLARPSVDLTRRLLCGRSTSPDRSGSAKTSAANNKTPLHTSLVNCPCRAYWTSGPDSRYNGRPCHKRVTLASKYDASVLPSCRLFVYLVSISHSRSSRDELLDEVYDSSRPTHNIIFPPLV